MHGDGRGDAVFAHDAQGDDAGLLVRDHQPGAHGEEDKAVRVITALHGHVGKTARAVDRRTLTNPVDLKQEPSLDFGHLEDNRGLIAVHHACTAGCNGYCQREV